MPTLVYETVGRFFVSYPVQERQHLEDTITWQYNTKHFLKSKDARV